MQVYRFIQNKFKTVRNPTVYLSSIVLIVFVFFLRASCSLHSLFNSLTLTHTNSLSHRDAYYLLIQRILVIFRGILQRYTIEDNQLDPSCRSWIRGISTGELLCILPYISLKLRPHEITKQSMSFINESWCLLFPCCNACANWAKLTVWQFYLHAIGSTWHNASLDESWSQNSLYLSVKPVL